MNGVPEHLEEVSDWHQTALLKQLGNIATGTETKSIRNEILTIPGIIKRNSEGAHYLIIDLNFIDYPGML